MSSMPICEGIAGGARMSADTDKQVLLLRGINVGGRNIMPMADLRAVLVGLGLGDVTTHIQSGNAVFSGGGALKDPDRRIADALQDRFGFRPAVMVIGATALARIAAENPYRAMGQARGSAVQIGFPMAPALSPDTARMAQIAAPDEVYHLTDRAFYLHAPSGIGRSKLVANAERLLGVDVTMRNQGVVEALNALARSDQC